MRIIKCDRCGATLDKGLKPWAFAICDSNTGEPYPASPFKDWDFCLECKDEIIEFVKVKPPKKSAPKPIAQIETPEANKAAMRPLDKGKMVALRKAGWSLKEISAEMNCSMGTVSKVLTEMLGKRAKEEKK